MGWALCVGAGSSRGTKNGVFPEWSALVDDLIGLDAGVGKAQKLSRSLQEDFAPDALIQAAKNRRGSSTKQFIELLKDLLYKDLKAKSDTDWSQIAKALTAASPSQINDPERWRAFIRFFTASYPYLTALQIARVIASTTNTGKEPATILSFNVEPLLYALIHACRVDSSDDSAKLRDLRILNRVTRGISYQEKPRIPYIFCHGLLPIDDGFSMFPTYASPEKLVFSEAEYLQLANSAFSWQSSLFLSTAVLRSIVFVGVSFSDPNLRRWLAWVHANRVDEFRVMRKTKRKKPPKQEPRPNEHYWLNLDPGNESEREWIESVVHHLGVRLVWMNSWKDVEKYLRKMLNLEENK
jgi:hypothetical protein